jgi:hypothetical protein
VNGTARNRLSRRRNNKQTICVNAFGEPKSDHRHCPEATACFLAEALPWSTIEWACDLATISK